MKTIEERANDFCQLTPITSNKIECDIAFKAYIQGAKDQKEIDDEETGKALLYCTNKTAQRVKRETVINMCEWINAHKAEYIRHTEKGDFLAPCIFRDLFEAIITDEDN